MQTWKARALLGGGGLLLAGHPLLLARAITWRAVPAVGDGQDPLLQTAILQQVLRAVPWTLERWQAPWLWPGRYSLTYMDPLIGQSLLGAWLPGVRALPALAYNVSLVVTLGLAAACTHLLARALGGGRVAGAAAAVAYVASPYAAGHLQHLNQLPTPWLPLALWGLLELSAGRWRGAFALTVALVFQVMSGVYYTVALALVVACVLPLVASRLPRRGWIGTAIALTGFGVALWAWSLPYRAAASEVEGFTRTAAQGGPFAARLFDFWHVSPAHWAAWPPVGSGRPVLYPSLVGLALAGLGFLRWAPVTVGRAATQRAVVMGLVVASGAATVLAFGRTLAVPGLEHELPMPWAWLQDHLWPLQAIRAPARLFLPATLTIALLAGSSLSTALSARRSLGLVLAAVALVDLAPGPIGRVRVELTSDERALVEDLRAQPHPTPWAMLPMPRRETDESPVDARAMLWAVLAQQPLAGGSSGFVPAEVAAMRAACAGPDCASALAARGVARLVVEPTVGEVPGTVTPQRVGRWNVYALNPVPPQN